MKALQICLFLFLFLLCLPVTLAQSLEQPRSQLFVIKQNGKFGFIDHDGSLVIPPQFEAVGAFRQGLCLVESSETIAYIDHSGAIIWEGPYVDLGRISEL